MRRPDCYECKHRRDLAGDAHSRCTHPSIGKTTPFDEMMATLASVGRAAHVTHEAAAELNIKGNSHGVRMGWFNWPFNFDPVWLEDCSGFEPKSTNEETRR